MARTKRTHTLTSNAPLLWRVSSFLGIFVMFSGLIGPRIITNGLLYTYHFAVYGTLGKALIFWVIAIGVLTYRRRAELTVAPWRRQNLRWLALSILCFSGAWLGITALERHVSTPYWAVVTHVLLLGSVVFAAGGCLGPATLRSAVRTFKREIGLATMVTVGFVGFLYVVYGAWELLAGMVLHSVQWLLGLSGLESTIILPRTLLLDKFGIDIAQYCSGVESIALFTGLYVVMGLLDWRQFNVRRYAGAFIPGLTILFACNILRVYLLILAGYYINQQIAFSLFHTYAGMIFFVLYSAFFWWLVYGWMLKPTAKVEQATAKHSNKVK